MPSGILNIGDHGNESTASLPPNRESYNEVDLTMSDR